MSCGYQGKDRCQDTKPENAQFYETKLDLVREEHLLVNSQAWHCSACELAFLKRQILDVLI